MLVILGKAKEFNLMNYGFNNGFDGMLFMSFWNIRL